MIVENKIPKQSQFKKLGEVCTYSKGKKPQVLKEAKSNECAVAYINIKAFEKGIFDEYTNGIKCNLCEEKDLLMVWDGARCGLIGKAKKGAVGSTLMKILPKENIHKEYLYHFISSKFQILNTRPKGVGIPHIEPTLLWNFELVVPPLPEQLLIVSKIEELLSDLENGKQQLQTAKQQLKVYRQSLLKWAFEGKLSEGWRKKQNSLQSAAQLLKKIKSERESILDSNNIKIKPVQTISEEEIEELPKLPNCSLWLKLGEILWSVKDGPHYSPKYQEHGIPFISGGNIRSNGIDFKNVKYISQELHDELSKRCKPMKMDVLYTKGGTTGIAKVNDYDIDFNVWVHVAVLKAIPSINPYYLQHALNSNHCYKQSQKYTHGVGNQDLGLTRMILISIPVCSIEEQNYIVEELESKLTVCDKIEETISNSLQQAEMLKQSILKKAFEGKLTEQNYKLKSVL